MIVRLLAYIVLVVSCSTVAHAATITWNGSADGNWSNGANWSGSSPPGSTDTAEFASGGTSVTVDGAYTVARVLFDSTSDMTFGVNDGSDSLTITSGITVSGSNNVAWGCPIILGADQTWTQGGSGVLTISGVISGAYALTTSGSGEMVFATSNTYSGGTTISAGTVAAGGYAFGSGLVTVASGATLAVSGSSGLAAQYYNYAPDTADFASPEVLQTSLGNQPLVLADSATTMNFGNAGVDFPAPYNAVPVNWQSLYSGQLTIGTAGIYTFNTTSDDGSFIWIDGKLVVSDNDFHPPTLFTGSIGLTAGVHGILIAYYQGSGGETLYAQMSGPNNTSMVDISTVNAMLTPDLLISSLAGAGAVQLTTGDLIVGFDNTNSTFSGSISGSGKLKKTGTGILTLAGSNGYTGVTAIFAGTLQMGIDAALPATASVLDEGVLDLNGHALGLGTIAGSGVIDTTAGSAASLSIGQGNANSVFMGIMQNTAGALSVEKTGSGILTMMGSSTFSGTTTIANGTMTLGGVLPVTANLIYHLDASNSNNYVQGGGVVSSWTDLSGHGNAFTVGSGDNGGSGPTVDSGAINGLDGLLFTASPLTSLSLAATTSPTTVFILNKETQYNSSTDGIWGFGGADEGLRMNTGSTWSNPGNGNDFTNPQGQMYINGAASNAVSSNQVDLLEAYAGSSVPALWSLTTINSYFSNGGRPWTGDIGEVVAYSTALSTTDRQAVEAYIAAKWQSGPTNPTPLSVGSAVVIDAGATLDLAGISPTIPSLAGGAGTVTNSSWTAVTLTLGDATSTSFAGAIQGNAGAVGVQKNGTGTLTLTGANTYTGTTTISAGTVIIDGGGSLSGTMGLITQSGGALIVNAGSVTLGSNGLFGVGYAATGTGTVTVNTGGTLDVGVGGGLTFVGGGPNGGPYGDGVLSIEGGIVTVEAVGAFPSDRLYVPGYSGGGTINLDAGALHCARTIYSSGSDPSYFNFNGGTLRTDIASTDYLYPGFTAANIRNGGAIIDTNGNAVTFAQALTHSVVALDHASDGGLTTIGTGTLVLEANENYTGATTIDAGTLQLGDNSISDGQMGLYGGGGTTQAGVGTITVNNSGTLLFAIHDVFGNETEDGGGVTIQVNAGGLMTNAAYTVDSPGAAFNALANLHLSGGTVRIVGGVPQFGLGGFKLTGTVTIDGTVQSTITQAAPSDPDYVNAIGCLNLDEHAATIFNVLHNTAGNDALIEAALLDTFTGSTLTKTGNGILALSSPSSLYTGVTTISAGTLSIGTMANGGSASSIGAATNAAANLVIDGGTLQYTGALCTSDHLFSVGTSGGIIDGSGSGALSLNNPGGIGFNAESGTRTLTLTGSTAANMLSAIIADSGGATTLVKNGTGSWALGGVDTYSGATTINAGALQIANPPMVQNGSFENPVLSAGTFEYYNAMTTGQQTSLGWVGVDGTGGGALVNNSGAWAYATPYPDGNQAYSVQQQCYLSQSLNFLPGTYSLSWWHCHRNDSSPTSNPYYFVLDGVNQGATFPLAGLSWSMMSTAFTITTAGAHTIGFLGTSAPDLSVGIDDVSLNAGGQLPAATVVNITAAGASLDLNDSTQTIASLSGVAGTVVALGQGSLTVGNGSSTTFSGVIGDGGGGSPNTGGSLIKIGSATLTLTGANTYTGATTISAGILQVTGSGGLGQTAISTASGATFAPHPGSSSTTIGMSGAGSAGASLTLGSGSTFDMVDAAIGTVDLNQNSGFASSGLTISGASLLFEVNASGADVLACSGGATVSGTNSISITGLGSGLTTGASYTLITASGGLNAGTWQFSGGGSTTTVTAGSTTYQVSLVVTATAVSLLIYPAPVISTRQTIDSDANGHIDRILVTTNMTLNDSFGGVTATVTGYSVTGFAAGPTGSSFYITFTEGGSPDTGATPTVQITANTSLGGSPGNQLLLVDGSPVISTDDAAPVLMSSTWTAGGSNGVAAGDAITLTFSETVTVASMAVTGIGLPVTGDSLSSTSIADQSASIVSVTLAGTPQLTPGGIYSSSTLTVGSPSGIYLTTTGAAAIVDAVGLHPLVGGTASAVDLGPASTTVAIIWSGASDPQSWPIGSVTLGSIANTHAVLTLQPQNVGNCTVDLSISASSSAPSGWNPAASAGSNCYLMKADNASASGSTPADPTAYALTLGTGDQGLFGGMLSGSSNAFALFFQAPLAVSASSGVQQTITVTVTAALPP